MTNKALEQQVYAVIHTEMRNRVYLNSDYRDYHPDFGNHMNEMADQLVAEYLKLEVL